MFVKRLEKEDIVLEDPRRNVPCLYFDSLSLRCERTNNFCNGPSCEHFICISDFFATHLVHFEYGVLTVDAVHGNKVYLVDEKNYLRSFTKSALCTLYEQCKLTIDKNKTRPPNDFIVIGAKLVHFKYGVLTVVAIYRDKVNLVDKKNHQHEFSKSALLMLYEQCKLTIYQNKK